MNKNFIEKSNFLNIYKNNRSYKQQDKLHTRALKFQIIIIICIIFIAAINYQLNPGFVNNLYIDQINRIYAVLVAVLTTILIGISAIDKQNKLLEPRYDYTIITFKQDYTSIVVYTFYLFIIGIFTNILYVSLLAYFNIYIIDLIFWQIRLFILLDSLFFTLYAVDELIDLIRAL